MVEGDGVSKLIIHLLRLKENSVCRLHYSFESNYTLIFLMHLEAHDFSVKKNKQNDFNSSK